MHSDLDELEVYGSDTQSGGTTSLASYKFEVCDSLVNIGPIKDMTLGMPAFLSVSCRNPHPILLKTSKECFFLWNGESV